MTDRHITRLSIHPEAAGAWRRFVDALPGMRRDDKELLVRDYLKICARLMLQAATRENQQVGTWQCPFAPEFDLVLRVTTAGDRTEITILSIRAHSA